MKKRLLIGVIITDCHVDFQEEIMRGIISQAFKSNCDIAVIAPLNNFYLKSIHKMAEKDIFRFILSDKFDGFLYDRQTFLDDDIREYIDSLLKESKKPVMLMDSGEHRSFETTSIDDCSAFEIITDHLVNVHKLKKIYCLTGPKKIFVSEERLKGYKNSMKKHGLYFDKSYVFYGDFWKNSAEELAHKILNGTVERPQAVVCGNDISAAVLVKELINGGLKVPEDIAVTGYDASVAGYQSSPAITSYSRPNYQLGAEAFRRLYRIITGDICNKVRSENGSLRLGKSCGCDENIHIRNEIMRKISINSEYESGLLYGDMLFDITNVGSYPKFADRIDNYTYVLLKNISIHMIQVSTKNSISISVMMLYRLSQNQPYSARKYQANISAVTIYSPYSAKKESIPLHIIFPLCTTMIIFSAISHCHSEKYLCHSVHYTSNG